MATVTWYQEAIGGAILLAFMALLAVVYIASIVWAYRDAERRGSRPVLVTLLVILLQPWPLGLVIWWLFRPSQAKSASTNHAHYDW